MPTPEYQREIQKSPELELEQEIDELNLPKVFVEEVREEVLKARKEEFDSGITSHFGDSALVFDINKITDEYTVLYAFLKVSPDDLTKKHSDLFKKVQSKIMESIEPKKGTEDDAEYQTIYDYVGWVANEFTDIYGNEDLRRYKQGRSM